MEHKTDIPAAVRVVLASAAALGAGWIAIIPLEAINYVLYGAPPEQAMKDPELLRQYIATLPTMALVRVLLAHAMGSLVCGLVSGLLTPSRLRARVVIGVLFTAAGLINLIWIPHPAWMWIDLLLYLPLVLLGGKIGALLRADRQSSRSA